MKNLIWIGLATALGTGVAIGSQITLSGRLGNLIGPVRTGLWMNVLGGLIAAVFVVGIRVFGRNAAPPIPMAGWVMLLIAGLLGVIIVSGTSFSIPKVGVTVGVATFILGQLLVSTVVDFMGWGSGDPIPFSWQRVLGLFVMAFAVYLLLPRDA